MYIYIRLLLLLWVKTESNKLIDVFRDDIFINIYIYVVAVHNQDHIYDIFIKYIILRTKLNTEIQVC